MKIPNKFNLCSALLSFLLFTPAKAEQNKLLDEAFLEFLAAMSEDNGQLSDPLDMLEISDDVITNSSTQNTVNKQTTKSEQTNLTQQNLKKVQ